LKGFKLKKPIMLENYLLKLNKVLFSLLDKKLVELLFKTIKSTVKSINIIEIKSLYL